MLAVALTIAGSDPSGGAGIQADLKTFHQFGVYGQAAITLLTVQNTQTLTRVEMIAPDLVRQQIEAVIGDIRPAAAKTGALGSAENVEAIAAIAAQFDFPLVVDPVMIGKHGTRLLSPEAEGLLKSELLPRAYLVTPNLPEAEVITGMRIETVEDYRRAAGHIMGLGCKAVLIKGGHSKGDPIDYLFHGEGFQTLTFYRLSTQHTHGTGCTYSAAITAGLALGNSLTQAVQTAREYIQEAIRTAPGLGLGFGPVNHFAPVRTSGMGTPSN